MKIFFTASYSGKAIYQDAYDKITESINELGHDLISLETQEYADLLGEKLISKITNKTKSKSDTKNYIHYAYLKKAADEADAFIIEASTDRFQLGYEASFALSLNKPILVLSQDKDYRAKIKDKKFFSKIYNNLDQLDDIIKNYLFTVKTHHLSVRLHINISPDSYNFLDWLSKKDKVSKSQIIRRLLNQERSNRNEYLEPENLDFI